MWLLVCVIFGTSVAGLAGAMCSPSAGLISLVQGAVFTWLLCGASQLQKAVWRPSFGRDKAALMIWPVLKRWIAHNETE
jgi:hypothetical protein